ncbi:MAG: hypothetical protein M3Q86_07520 [Verrucomicrobiota bacterium]|nr:hypothetical protein [Verrucomicrobiota bacterium]
MLQIKDRTTRAVNYVGSNAAWEQYLPAVKQAADKVRNFRPSKKATPPPPDGTPPAKKRMTGQQSYGDIEGLFEGGGGIEAGAGLCAAGDEPDPARDFGHVAD